MEFVVDNLRLFSYSFSPLVVLWVLSHIIILFGLIRFLHVPIYVLIGVLIIGVYWLKPYSYDLEKYATYYETGHLEAFGNKGESYYGIQMHWRDLSGDSFTAYEPGFDLTVRTFRRIFSEGQLIKRIEVPGIEYKKTGFIMDPFMAFIIFAALLMLFYSYRNLSCRNEKVAVNGAAMTIFFCIALGSLFFFIGSQNTIRQFIAICISTVGFSIAVRTQKPYLLALAFFSLFFHYWTAIYCGFLITTYFLLTIAGDKSYRLGVLSIKKSEILALCGSSLGAILLKIAIVTGVVHSIPWLDSVKIYSLQPDAFTSLEKIAGVLKISVIGVIFLVSEYLAGKETLVGKVNIRDWRRMMLLLILPFMLYPELLSRFIYYYLCAELFFLCWALTSSKIRLKLAGTIVYLSYGFAPNVVNILSR